jgi:hypothetical protein
LDNSDCADKAVQQNIKIVTAQFSKKKRQVMVSVYCLFLPLTSLCSCIEQEFLRVLFSTDGQKQIRIYNSEDGTVYLAKITIFIPDRPGSLAELAAAFARHDAN